MFIFKNNDKKFIDVSYEWLENRKATIKKSTYSKYLALIELYLISSFSNVKFNSIKQSHLNSFFDEDSISMLSNSTKSTILIILYSIIDYGINKKYKRTFIKPNIRFKKDKNNITYFTKKEQIVLVEYLNSNLNLRNLAILMALYTGIRIGELCALKWSDIDFINNTLSINKTVQRIKNTDNSFTKTILVVDNPKTESSARIIPLSKFLITVLKKNKPNKDYYIFSNHERVPKDPRAVEKYFKSVLKKNNLKNLNFHSLRHTFATRLREQKVDIKVISELLGHSDWKTTQSIYIHASEDCKRDSINNLWKSCNIKSM